MRAPRYGFLVAVLLLLFSPLASSAQSDEEAIRQTIDGLITAFEAGNTDEMMSFYEEQAVVLPAGRDAQIGREASRASLEELFAQFEIESDPQIQTVEVHGDLAHVLLHFHDTMTPKAGGDAIHGMGPWLVVLRRQEDGSWKVFQEIWSEQQ